MNQFRFDMGRIKFKKQLEFPPPPKENVLSRLGPTVKLNVVNKRRKRKPVRPPKKLVFKKTNEGGWTCYPGCECPAAVRTAQQQAPIRRVKSNVFVWTGLPDFAHKNFARTINYFWKNNPYSKKFELINRPGMMMENTAHTITAMVDAKHYRPGYPKQIHVVMLGRNECATIPANAHEVVKNRASQLIKEFINSDHCLLLVAPLIYAGDSEPVQRACEQVSVGLRSAVMNGPYNVMFHDPNLDLLNGWVPPTSGPFRSRFFDPFDGYSTFSLSRAARAIMGRVEEIAFDISPDFT